MKAPSIGRAHRVSPSIPKFKFRPKGPHHAARTLAWSALLALILLRIFSTSAQADCFAVTNPDYRALDPLVDKNGLMALSAVSARLRALPPAATHVADTKTLAALYAVQADAYSILEFDAKALASAARGLAFVHGATDPLRLELLYTEAYNVRTKLQIYRAIGVVERARLEQSPGSLSDVCLRIALGALERRAGQYALAARTDIGAYRTSEAPVRAEAHALAAYGLSYALRDVGDDEEALMLVRQSIAWWKTQRDSLQLSVSEWLDGEILSEMRKFHDAIAAFTQARAISISVGDRQGVAWDNMEICHALVELRQYRAALPRCAAAATAFLASKSMYAFKQTQVYNAEIDLHDGHVPLALQTLNYVLDHNGNDMEPTAVGVAYRTRSKAYGALHDYRKAYRDLQQYLRRYHAQNLAIRLRLQETVKERLQAAHEIARNAVLHHQLELTRERATQESERETETVHLASAGGAAGTLIIALLSYILITSLRHRRQLLRLARDDNLTGIPNRGRITELAKNALEAAATEQRPLTIAIIDLDHFKTINDRCGHAVGDYVLKEFADVSRASLRAGDVFGRWGGEEFLLLLPNTTLDTALASIERLRAQALKIHVPLPDAKDSIRVTFSAGLATTTQDAKSLDEIIARADVALYEAKNTGRDLVRIDPESMETASTGVRRAIHLN